MKWTGKPISLTSCYDIATKIQYPIVFEVVNTVTASQSIVVYWIGHFLERVRFAWLNDDTNVFNRAYARDTPKLAYKTRANHWESTNVFSPSQTFTFNDDIFAKSIKFCPEQMFSLKLQYFIISFVWNRSSQRTSSDRLKWMLYCTCTLYWYAVVHCITKK